MMKKVGFATILSVLLLTGCAHDDSDGNGNSISGKNFVIVLQNVESGICESSLFRDELQSNGLEGFITEETDTNTNCSSYGKQNDENECIEEFIGDGNVNCIIGFDSLNGISKQVKRIGNVNLYDSLEIVSSEIQ